MILPWVTFILAAAGIIGAGIRLAPYGEALGNRTGIGQGWIGLLFLATLTSIPEMTTTISGATLDVPNIALGNAFGSNLFNVVIIAVMDILLLGRGPFLLKARGYHTLSGGIAVLLTLFGVLGIVMASRTTLFGVSPISFMILAGYVAGVCLLFHAERHEVVEEEPRGEVLSLKAAIIGFVVCAAVIVVSGIFLVRASKDISSMSGLSTSFMGAILVAIVTSLPELATSIGALRIGAHDMIVGNLFGSNMFNILTIFFADVAYRKGSIFASLRGGENDQIIVAVCGVLLTVVAMVSLGARSRRRILGIGVDSAILLASYLGATALIVCRGIQF